MISFANLSATSEARTVTHALPAVTQVYQVRFGGTFGGATAWLESRGAGETEWISHREDTEATAALSTAVYLSNGDDVRIAITGATGTTAINARVS